MPAGTCYASRPSVPSAGAGGWAAGREGAGASTGRQGELEPAGAALPLTPAPAASQWVPASLQNLPRVILI